MIEKLKLNKEFRRLYGRGNSFVNRGFVSYILPYRGQAVRYGITVSKKLGKAVKRNRAKRLLAAAFKQIEGNITPGCQMVFVARAGLFAMKSYEIAAIMRSHLSAAGFWKESNE